MGGHVAEKLFIGKNKTSSGCSGDFQGATKQAYMAVTNFGFFGEELGFVTPEDKDQELSEEMKAKIETQVRKILRESEQRVEKLLDQKGKEVRELARNLYWYDYLNQDEMEKIFKGEKLDKERVREIKPGFLNQYDGYETL